MRESFRSDRGASIFMLAISLFLLIGASAIAVDIAAIWLDRSTDQKVTDAAAAVGVLVAVETGGQDACESALNYVAVNTPDLNTVDTTDCVQFDKICNPDNPLETEWDFPAGRYEITVVHPVTDTHDLMTSGIVGGTAQPLVDDGKPCQRLAVKMTSTRNSLFAQVLGFSSGRTSVHTVAKRIVGDDEPPLNLIVLDRTGCNTISVNGGGQIVADPVVHPDGYLVGGLIIADSDGSECSGTNGVINVSGLGSVIRADGPAGCGGNPFTFKGFPAEEGCGTIRVLAPNDPGPCTPPACSNSGGGNAPNPTPSPLGSRYTRAPADHRYNCYSNYTTPPLDTLWAAEELTTANQQNIDECEETATRDPYIYDLIEFVGPRTDGKPDSTYEYWKAERNEKCNVDSNITINNQNLVIDCNLQITSGKSVTINNGNVVFDQDVTVQGALKVNPPADKPWTFFRGGKLTKAGTGTLEFNNAMVYMAQGSSLKLSGSGSGGALIWTAPTAGDFADLALWSDSVETHAWSGQSALTLRGIFFMPRGIAAYSGGGSQEQTDAQWLAWNLTVGGGGVLHIAPGDGALPALSDRAELIR